MYNVSVTASQMKEIEAEANKNGLSYTQMMENAGRAAYEEIIKDVKTDTKMAVVTGKGNNGGDGYVIARLLHESGVQVCIIQADGEPKTDDAILNCDKCKQLGVDFVNSDNAEDAINDAHIIVDAIYGTGFKGELKPGILKLCNIINHSNAIICALDIPSGINSDTGEVCKGAIKANKTVVFHLLKKAHTKEEVFDYFGKIMIKDIGIRLKQR